MISNGNGDRTHSTLSVPDGYKFAMILQCSGKLHLSLYVYITQVLSISYKVHSDTGGESTKVSSVGLKSLDPISCIILWTR